MICSSKFADKIQKISAIGVDTPIIEQASEQPNEFQLA